MSETETERLSKKIDELKKLKASIAATIATKDADETLVKKSDVISSKEVREDVSDKVRDLVKEIAKEGDYRFGVFVGNAGGKRKLIQCPHCEKKMVVAGIKGERKKSDKPPSQKQKDWMEFVKIVGKLPENQGRSRTEHMKMGKKLKAEGITLENLKNIASMNS